MYIIRVPSFSPMSRSSPSSLFRLTTATGASPGFILTSLGPVKVVLSTNSVFSLTLSDQSLSEPLSIKTLILTFSGPVEFGTMGNEMVEWDPPRTKGTVEFATISHPRKVIISNVPETPTAS